MPSVTAWVISIYRLDQVLHSIMYTGRPSKYSIDGDNLQSRLCIPPGMEGLTAFRGPGSRQLRDAEKRAERRRQLEERSARLLSNLSAVPSNRHHFAPSLPGFIAHSSRIDLSSQVSPVVTGSRSYAASHMGTNRPINNFACGEAGAQPESSDSISHTDWFCQAIRTYTGDQTQTAPASRCLSPEQITFDHCDFGVQPNNVNMSPYTSLPLMSKSHGLEMPPESHSSAYKEGDDQQVISYNYDPRQLPNWPDFDRMQYDPHCDDQEGDTASDNCIEGANDFDFGSW